MSLLFKSLISITGALISLNLTAQNVELLPYEPLVELSEGSASMHEPAPKELETTQTEQPKLETMLPASEQAAPQIVDDIMVSPTLTQTRNTPRKPEALLGTQVRQINGKLVRSHTSFGPRYPIRLLSPSGKRIAYVDMSQIFIHDLRPYLDQAVSIQGEVRSLVPGSKELVVVARTLRVLP